MVEHKLLRRERTHAVAEQNEWLPRVFVPGNHSEGNHVFHELIETTASKVAKGLRRLRGLAMAAVIVSVNDEAIVYQSAGELRISADVLTESVCYLHNAPDRSMPIPSNAGDRQTIRASELEPLQV